MAKGTPGRPIIARQPVGDAALLPRRGFIASLGGLIATAALLCPLPAPASSGAELIARAQAVLRRLLATSATAARLGDYVHGILIFPSILSVGTEVKTGTGVLILDGECAGYFALTLRNPVDDAAGLESLTFYLMDMATNVAFVHAPASLTESAALRFVAASADRQAMGARMADPLVGFPMDATGLLPRFDRPKMAMKHAPSPAELRA